MTFADLLNSSEPPRHIVRRLGRPRVILWGTCAPPVEFCEVDPMQTESLACTIVESSPPDPCICAQQMVCRLSMRSLNRSGCARARADDSGIQGARALLAFWRYLDSGVTCILALCMPVFARACARSEAYEIFQSYACHLRNPAVQQATVEIRDTEFPAPPPPRFLAARRA